jgi:hypothetical protein
MFSTDKIFFLNISNQWLVEPVDAEPKEKEDDSVYLPVYILACLAFTYFKIIYLPNCLFVNI